MNKSRFPYSIYNKTIKQKGKMVKIKLSGGLGYVNNMFECMYCGERCSLLTVLCGQCQVVVAAVVVVDQ